MRSPLGSRCSKVGKRDYTLMVSLGPRDKHPLGPQRFVMWQISTVNILWKERAQITMLINHKPRIHVFQGEKLKLFKKIIYLCA